MPPARGDIFGGKYRRETTESIYDLKRDLLGVKRAVSPLMEIGNRLTRFDASRRDGPPRPARILIASATSVPGPRAMLLLDLPDFFSRGHRLQ